MRKKPLPRFIRRVAVVTSESGAAVRDILARFENLPLEKEIFNVTVQGESAPPFLVEALQAADCGGFDVILLARGGGSNTDLAAFNDESVVRTLANLKTPTISGIGHEIDFTLCDFVADFRASTPTAAAQKIVEIVVQSWAALDFYKKTFSAQIARILNEKTQRYAFLKARLNHLAPTERLKFQRARLENFKMRLPRLMFSKYENAQKRLEFLRESLAWKNPQTLLSRGYAMVFDENQNLLFDALRVKKGAFLKIQLGNGAVLARAEEILEEKQ